MPKVLVVDDDKSLTSLLKTLLELEPEGFEVDVVATGDEALHRVQTVTPDVLMVDYHLKDMDGIELIQHLRSHPDFVYIPILMASGLDVEREAMQAGANRFLLKPFEPGDLAGIFLELIG